MPHIEALWAQYVEDGKPLGRRDRVKVEAFVGGSIYYSSILHEYTNEAGEVYLSGSVYAHQFEEVFDQAKISGALAKKFGVSAEAIVKMWELKSDISKGLGTALHSALELYGNYHELAEKLQKSTHLHDNPMVMEAVQLFFSEHPQDALYEVLVADHENKRAGRIDRLVLNDGGYLVTDFKTDVNIEKKLPIYQKQLSFYAAILEANGCRVAGLELYHWDGKKWNTYKLEKERV